MDQNDAALCVLPELPEGVNYDVLKKISTGWACRLYRDGPEPQLTIASGFGANLYDAIMDAQAKL